uniref:Arginine-hydroxylase NDUFAF5, mitochondrial n=1 Tax=Angiostrongylus cantonensis TaxID=6313 RepID=A0A158P6K5_ANGCA
LKRRQRDWAVCQPDFDDAQYLKDEIGWRVADKVFDLTKFNPVALDIGCGMGHIAPHMIKENVGKLIQCDMSEQMVKRSKGPDDKEVGIERVVCDEETLELFTADHFDLLLSSLSAHWINDLPQWFRRCYEILKPDCPFIGALLAEDTLFELRCSLQLAELERCGGVGSHISPFIKPPDIGSLLNLAGFDMVTLDSDEVEVGYPNMLALMYDLQLMAESHCTFSRSRTIRRDVLIAADAIYRVMYAKEGKYPATFRVISFIGWKPGPEMPKPAKRGSQNLSFKDLSKIVEDPELMKSLAKKKDNGDNK